MPGLATVCITVGNAKRIRTCVCSSFFFYFINSIVCFVGAFTWKTKIKRSRLKWTSRSFLINSWQRVGCSTVSQQRSGCQEMYRRQLWKRQNHKAVTFSQDDQVRNQTHHYMDLMKWVNSFKWTGQRQQMSMPMHTSSSRPSSLCPLPPPTTRCWSPHNHRHFRKKIGSIAVFGSQARLKALFRPPVWAEWRYFKGWVCRNNVTGCLFVLNNVKFTLQSPSLVTLQSSCQRRCWQMCLCWSPSWQRYQVLKKICYTLKALKPSKFKFLYLLSLTYCSLKWLVS